jgi:ATP-dependent DNA helicase RecQ
MLETSSQPERMAWLAQVVPGLSGSGVIYVLTVADTTRVASFLRTQGIDAHAYSGETESERRLELEDALIANEVKALVATSRSDLLAACANNERPNGAQLVKLVRQSL